MANRIRNRLGAERAARGWSQARAAEAAGVTRQSYAAIEGGQAVPSTEVALRLARAYGCAVESLFELPDAPARRLRARWVGVGGGTAGRRVRLAKVGGRLLALDAAGAEGRMGGAADGVVIGGGEEVEVALLAERPPAPDLVVVGCDPAFGVVAESLRRERGVEVAWWSRSSRSALEALASGAAHVAGAHLRDPDGAGYNEGWIRRLVPFPCTRVSFAVWEQGLLVAGGNPKGIVGLEDLARPGVRMLNREPGSGSRALLDARLEVAGIPAGALSGYGSCVRGHLGMGEAIAAGLADVGIAIRAAGAAFGLDVLPLEMECYELVVPDHFLDLPAVGSLLEVLGRPGLRAQVESLGGYDASEMGKPARSRTERAD